MCKHCWDDDSRPHHKDFIRGGSDDGWEDTPHRSKHGKNKVRPKNRPGCPGNDNGPHIYVWTTEGQFEDLFFRYFGFHKYEAKKCCGCGKRDKGMRSSRFTERYTKKFKPVGRYSYPERKHAGYAEFRRRWLVQHGYTREWYGY